MPEPEVLTVEQQEAESAAALETQRLADESAAASAAAGETVKTPEEQAAEQEKRKGGVQRRINELVRKAATAEARAEYFEKVALGKAAETKPATDEAKPMPEAADFETTEEFLRATATWSKEEAKREVRAEMEEKTKADSQKSEQDTQAQVWQEKESATQEKHADYEDVTAAAMETFRQLNTQACHAVAHAIQVSDAGPELLYHFGEHREELEALSKLHPTAAIMALGKIEGRLAGDNGTGPVLVPQPRASKPPTPVKKAAPAVTPHASDPASDKALTDEEWLAARNAELKSR